jgi:hypothetical protein
VSTVTHEEATATYGYEWHLHLRVWKLTLHTLRQQWGEHLVGLNDTAKDFEELELPGCNILAGHLARVLNAS